MKFSRMSTAWFVTVVFSSTVILLTACGSGDSGGGGSSDPQIGTWTSPNDYSITFMSSNRFTIYNSGLVDSWGTYTLAGSDLTLLDQGGIGACGSVSGNYHLAYSGKTSMTFTLVSDSCTARNNIMTAGAWAKQDTGFPYFEIYGTSAGDYEMTTSGHTLVGTSNEGNDFTVTGYDRFILYVPQTSMRIPFDAIGLDAGWVNSTVGDEYGHYTYHMEPTTGTWATNESCIEGAPDGNTMENTMGVDAFYGFSTMGASNLHIHVF